MSEGVSIHHDQAGSHQFEAVIDGHLALICPTWIWASRRIDIYRTYRAGPSRCADAASPRR